ncbi:alpha/beta-hydrolase [Xylariomycetidae sp. FL0641]|nr:alpha/beta-hydrolase [Xylariomycetidae sp. FL0641]
MSFTTTLQRLVSALLVSSALYAAFLAILAIPFFQNHAIYLHGYRLTWNQDTNYPEQWGFLKNQVTPFSLNTPDGEVLHAWHVLPLQLYNENMDELVAEPEGLAPDIKDRLSFKLLRDDPESLLVIYLHGAGGTLGSGWRPPSYRAMSVAAPRRIHTVAIDYRGYGTSTGSPTEQGLLTDAATLSRWAMEEAGIPPSRIAVFGQSVGTAVSISLAHHMASLPEPVRFSGIVLVAPFADVELLTATYKVGGIIPILGPVAGVRSLLSYLNTFIRSKWPSRFKLAEIVHDCENTVGEGDAYRITIVHAEDDLIIPWSHSDMLFWHAVNASKPGGIAYEEWGGGKDVRRVERGAGGWMLERKAPRGWIKQEIVKYGVHDKIMSYPVVSLAIANAFGDNIH